MLFKICFTKLTNSQYEFLNVIIQINRKGVLREASEKKR